MIGCDFLKRHKRARRVTFFSSLFCLLALLGIIIIYMAGQKKEVSALIFISYWMLVYFSSIAFCSAIFAHAELKDEASEKLKHLVKKHG